LLLARQRITASFTERRRADLDHQKARVTWGTLLRMAELVEGPFLSMVFCYRRECAGTLINRAAVIGKVDVALIEPFFGLARGFILLHAGLDGAIRVNPATVSKAGEGGRKAANNDQHGSQSEPNHCDLRDRSEMLRQGKHEAQEAELGDGDANSDNGFGGYRRHSKPGQFLGNIHGEIGR
jgi:hypothetical protein